MLNLPISLLYTQPLCKIHTTTLQYPCDQCVNAHERHAKSCKKHYGMKCASYRTFCSVGNQDSPYRAQVQAIEEPVWEFGLPLQGSPNSSQAPHQPQWNLYGVQLKTCQNLIAITSRLVGAAAKESILCGANESINLSALRSRKL